MTTKAVRSFFAPAPEPPTELGRYRILSSTAAIRVSPLQLGGQSIGDAWSGFLGSMSREKAFELMDAYHDSGGNYIDTANNYQNEQSEIWIGEWMKARNNRDDMVIATKFSFPYKTYEKGKLHAVNYAGNSRRSIHASVRDSLKKLQTDWIDILYLHVWDWTTSIEELMDSLDALVKSGQVLYLGVSDAPAWVVSAANMYARGHGKTQFSIYSGRWNVMARDIEREIVPMCQHFGMAIAPWDALGRGKFQSKKAIDERKRNSEPLRGGLYAPEQTEQEVRVSEALEKVASEHGIESVTAIALAWVMSKAPNVYPLVGGRKVEHLKDNIQALKIKLSDEQVEFLESVVPFQVGFPMDTMGPNPHDTGKVAGPVGICAPMAYHLRPKSILRS